MADISGIRIKPVKPGDGTSPADTKTVAIAYHYTFADDYGHYLYEKANRVNEGAKTYAMIYSVKKTARAVFLVYGNSEGWSMSMFYFGEM
jgi:hypothetical protein